MKLALAALWAKTKCTRWQVHPQFADVKGTTCSWHTCGDMHSGVCNDPVGVPSSTFHDPEEPSTVVVKDRGRRELVSNRAKYNIHIALG
jgi:hypothetical protein